MVVLNEKMCKSVCLIEHVKWGFTKKRARLGPWLVVIFSFAALFICFCIHFFI
jgi:hypothetical protein